MASSKIKGNTERDRGRKMETETEKQTEPERQCQRALNEPKLFGSQYKQTVKNKTHKTIWEIKTLAKYVVIFRSIIFT